MNFENIASRFASAEPGTDSFKMLYRDCFQLMKSDPLHAGLYFVVGIAAQAYVRKYEDQGVTCDFSDAAKAILVGYNSKVVLALASDANVKLQLLGEVAIDYEWHVRDF